MRIGIDGNEANVRNRVGGGKFALHLLRSLHAKRGAHQFTVYLKQPPLESMPSLDETWQYKVFGPTFFWTRFALPIRLFQESKKPDVFFTPSHYGPLFSPVPTVVSVMDIAYEFFPTYFGKKDLWQLRFWTKQSLNTASRILAISQHTKDDLVETYSIDPNRVSIAYPGYEDKVFYKRPAEEIEKVKEKYQIKSPYVLFIGTLQPRKNLERLIDAFQKLQKNDVTLVIAGKKGWLFDQILTHAKTVGIEKQVLFTDFVPEEELPALLSGASVFVLPSLYEGFGIPILEAFGCGVPVVCSRVSSLPEVAGDAALLFEPTDTDEISAALAKALYDTNERQRLMSAGEKRIQSFSWDFTAQQTLRVLEEVGHGNLS